MVISLLKDYSVWLAELVLVIDVKAVLVYCVHADAGQSPLDHGLCAMITICNLSNPRLHDSLQWMLMKAVMLLLRIASYKAQIMGSSSLKVS